MRDTLAHADKIFLLVVALEESTTSTIGLSVLNIPDMATFCVYGPLPLQDVPIVAL